MVEAVQLEGDEKGTGMSGLIRELLRPYRGSLAMILVAMLVQSTMTLAAPWPLKIVIDNVVVGRKLDPWLAHLIEPVLAHAHRAHLAEIAALAVILIAVLNAVASYTANYFTESVGQWVANDLRMRTYHHLQYLSLRYYDSHQSGVLLSTITADVLTIQNFASSATLGIVVDMFTILGMLVVMFFLNWDFTLIAVAITPLLLLLATRFKKAVKSSTHEVRKQQSNIVAVVQQDLESIRVVTAFGRQELEQQTLAAVSAATVAAALKARQVKALLSPIVSVIVSFCVAFVLWRGSLLVLRGGMTAGELTVFLSYLASFFKPVKDLASMNNSIAQTAVAVERIRTILDADAILPEKPDANEKTIKGEIVFDHVAFAYDASCPVLRDVSFTVKPGQMIGVVGPTGGGKSTIMSLIPRFYDPSAGAVLWTVLMFAITGCRRYVIRSAMCCRRQYSFAGPCGTTLLMAARTRPRKRSSRPQSWPMRTSSSPACPTATRLSLVIEAILFPADSGSVSGSHARSYATIPS